MSIARVNSPRKWTQPCLPDENVPTDSIYDPCAQKHIRQVWGKIKLICTTVTQNATLQDKCCTAWGRRNVVGAPDKLQRLEERGKMLSLKDIHSKDDNNNAYMDRFSSKLSLYYFIIYYYCQYILFSPCLFSSSRQKHQSQTPAFRHYGKKKHKSYSDIEKVLIMTALNSNSTTQQQCLFWTLILIFCNFFFFFLPVSGIANKSWRQQRHREPCFENLVYSGVTLSNSSFPRREHFHLLTQ